MPLDAGSRDAGTQLGPYEIIAPIGAGDMGEVYRARDTRLDRTVAIKVLPEHVPAAPPPQLAHSLAPLRPVVPANCCKEWRRRPDLNRGMEVLQSGRPKIRIVQKQAHTERSQSHAGWPIVRGRR